MELNDLKLLWHTFETGEPLSDKELNTLIKSAEQGLLYLQSRRESLASIATIIDLEKLRSYKRFRKQLP